MNLQLEFEGHDVTIVMEVFATLQNHAALCAGLPAVFQLQQAGPVCLVCVP